MKIAFIAKNFPPVTCGVGDYTACLAEAAAREGLDVVVLTGTHVPAHAPCRPGVRVRRVIPVDGGFQSALLAALAEEKPDLISFQYTPNLYGITRRSLEASFLPILLKRREMAPVTTVHELYSPWAGPLRHRAASAAQRLQLLPLGTGSRLLLTNTEARVERLQRWLPWKRDNIFYVSAGSTIERLPMTAGTRMEIRSRWGLEGFQVISTFGMLHAYKDMESLVTALGLLPQPVKLLCVGDQGVVDETRPRKERIMEIAQQAGVERMIVWTGRLSTAEVSACLSISDVFAFPVVGGPSGRHTSLMAALAHGLPLVAFDGPEMDVHFRKDPSTHLVPPHNPMALARAFQYLLENTGVRRESGEASRALYDNVYTWQNTLSATLGETRRSSVAPVNPGDSLHAS